MKHILIFIILPTALVISAIIVLTFFIKTPAQTGQNNSPANDATLSPFLQKVTLTPGDLSTSKATPSQNSKLNPPVVTYKASDTPKFTLKLPQMSKIGALIRSFFKKAYADDGLYQLGGSTIKTQVSEGGKAATEITAQISPLADNQLEISLSAKDSTSFKPGAYQLLVEVTNDGQTRNITQDFSWGVLAVNFNKSIYSPNEKAHLMFSVLDSAGKPVCNPDIKAQITSPEGKTTALSTLDDSIHTREDCGRFDPNHPVDFEGYYQISGAGKYTIEVTALQVGFGKEAYSVSDYFLVDPNAAFDVERIGTTRIFPYNQYTNTFNILPRINFQGEIIEKVPASFKISNVSGGGQTITKENNQYIIWQASLQKGQKTTLSYTYKAPMISPEFYLLGPLTFLAVSTSGESKPTPEVLFRESRQWQIASDAITIGATLSNSGNQTNSSSFSFNHTTDANTKALVVVVTGMDTSDTDSAVSSITFDSVALTHPVTRYRSGSVFIDIWYKSIPAIASTKAIAVTMGGTNTDVQATAVNLVDSTATGGIVYDSNDSGTGSSWASAIVNPAKTGSIAVGGGLAPGGDPTLLSVTTGTEVTGSEVDMGNQTASVGYAAESGGSATITWEYGFLTDHAFAATFYSQFTPTVALNTPADAATGQSTTPDLVFTGTDLNSDTIEYQLQVDTSSTFDSQASYAEVDGYNSSNRDSYSYLTATVTKIGQSFTGNGGVLSYADTYIVRWNNPTGDVYAKIYAYTGTWGSQDGTPTGAALATSDAVAANSINTSVSFVPFTFTGANKITLTNGTHYFLTLESSGGDASNAIGWGNDISSPSHSGNYAEYTTSWVANSSRDNCFYVYTDSTAPLLSKLSVTPDATFADVTNGADTTPFASGDQIKYTVQAGDVLTANTTYYWRVAGKDPLGSATYGAWATTQSFTVGGGAPSLKFNGLQMQGIKIN